MKICRDEYTNRDYIWYARTEITFQREHVIFAIEHYELLAENRYPPEPSTGVTLASISIIKPSWNHASNIKIEIDHRLKTTKEAGEALMWEVQHGLIDYDILSPPAKRALNFISGWRRRSQTYSEWKKYNKKFDQLVEAK